MNIGKTYLLPNEKLQRGLCKLYGINHFLSHQITIHLGLPIHYKVKQLTHSETESLLRVLDQFFVFDIKLRVHCRQIFEQQVQIRSVRGMRRKLGLPCNGQRTKTNARTALKNRQYESSNIN
jgi:small subunit ribosomal protein S13